MWKKGMQPILRAAAVTVVMLSWAVRVIERTGNTQAAFTGSCKINKKKPQNTQSQPADGINGNTTVFFF